MSNYTRVRHVAYHTIQCGSGPEDTLVFNSDLVYGNPISDCVRSGER